MSIRLKVICKNVRPQTLSSLILEQVQVKELQDWCGQWKEDAPTKNIYFDL